MKQSKFILTLTILMMAATPVFISCGDDNDDDAPKTETPTASNKDNGELPSDSDTVYTNCPDDKHPHIIDLGLPSGTKWACCNVGASAPENYGNYYAWGEVQTKNYFGASTYQFAVVNSVGNLYDAATEQYYSYTDIGTDIEGTNYDAATFNWGAPWRMPTFEQCLELINNCSWEWTSQNDVFGQKIIGPNAGTIFLPAAGYRWYSDLGSAGSYGVYWSSTINEIIQDYANFFDFESKGADTYNNDRSYGFPVRPVRKN